MGHVWVRNRKPGCGTDPALSSASLIADIMDLSGMVNSGAATGQSDPFAMQMSYDPSSLGNEAASAAAGGLQLAWLDPVAVAWNNATAGDFSPGGSAMTNYQGSYASFATANSITDGNLSNFVGSWGVDIVTHTAWAVIDHNSQFSVESAVPEPGTMGLIGLASMALIGRRRRRQS